MPDKPSLLDRIVHRLFGSVIERAINAAVSVRVDDSAGWETLHHGGPQDRPWSELLEDLTDVLEAWRKNFFVRRLVTLTHSYVVGGGIQITSKHSWVERFIKPFWDHPKNEMSERLEPMCDELTRAGELFVALFTNKIDGNSYVRLVPASQISDIKTAENDYETELAYGERQPYTTELKWWISPEDPAAFLPSKDGTLPPVMIHVTINKPVGATRGEGDLGPVLKWAKRYANWLEDRVRLNRIRTRQGILDVTIADDSKVKAKKQQLRRDNPAEAGIYIHGSGEETTLHNLEIKADDVKEDGRALRLAITTGANTALHYTGEGDTVNYATAREMGEPTARFYSSRQEKFTKILIKIVTIAYQRKVALGLARMPASGDLQLEASVTEVARQDNLELAQAAKEVVEALAVMKSQGWIDDRKAIRWAHKFAGEVIGEDEIDEILENADPELLPASLSAIPRAESAVFDRILAGGENGSDYASD